MFVTWAHANTTGTVGFLYETLFAYDPLTGEFIPWLAESGGWTDPTTYDRKLREGMAVARPAALRGLRS